MDITQPLPQIPRHPPFLRLPKEIRLQIFEYLLVYDHPLSIYDVLRAHPIQQTCRLLRDEALDVFFGRNRFTVSHHMELVETLDKAGAAKISRMIRLRLVQLGTSGLILRGDCIALGRLLPGTAFVDVDFLRGAPWFRLNSSPDSVTKKRPTRTPDILIHMKNSDLNLQRGRLERFHGQSEINVRLVLLLEMMSEMLRSILRGVDKLPLELNRCMLDYMVRHWLRISHILTCAKPAPQECEDCKQALAWLTVARQPEGRSNRPMHIPGSEVRLQSLLAGVGEFESMERELAGVDLGIGRMHG